MRSMRESDTGGFTGSSSWRTWWSIVSTLRLCWQRGSSHELILCCKALLRTCQLDGLIRRDIRRARKIIFDRQLNFDESIKDILCFSLGFGKIFFFGWTKKSKSGDRSKKKTHTVGEERCLCEFFVNIVVTIWLKAPRTEFRIYKIK